MANTTQSTAIPQAGEHKRTAVTEYWCLAPRPIPLNTPPVPYHLNPQKANQTTIDLGSEDYWGTEFSFRVVFANIFMFFLFTLIVHGLVVYRQVYYVYNSWTEAILYSFQVMWIYYIINIGFVLCLAIPLNAWAIFKTRPSTPVRFNREKRQAACQLDNGDVYLIDWETINAQMEQAVIVNPRFITNPAQLSINFPLPNGRDAIHLSLNYGTELAALGEWEALRLYMEYGLDHLKEHLYTPQELADQQAIEAQKGTLRYYNQQCASHPFGSVPYFYALKTKKKLEKDGYYWWCLLHICSGWTLPCYMAGLLNKLPRKGFNQAIRDWSKPIPKSQWAKPSDELIQQTDTLTQAYAKGISFKQYFTQQEQAQ